MQARRSARCWCFRWGGEELSGPGGDGWVQVVTPRSPVGKALVGAGEGDSFEIVVDGRDREWTVVDLG